MQTTFCFVRFMKKLTKTIELQTNCSCMIEYKRCYGRGNSNWRERGKICIYFGSLLYLHAKVMRYTQYTCFVN